MLKELLINSTVAASLELLTQTNAPTLNTPQGSISVAALLRPTGRGMRDGELSKPDLVTYVVIFLVMFVLVVMIVLFINCQLKNSLFATMPYDRSLREARTSWKTARV
ncbi:small integral membrane protein 32-like [Acipenser ruthenus]|uniref:small integral membrane protein 32-like n=1 Tax=Acipenser ruthenus TaxID=7906 RepID=UPI00145BEA3D|nr:small integral membrane protein 32-like [Acipenser ruthenus]